MLKKSKIAVSLRNNKWIYSSYINLANLLNKSDTWQVQSFVFFLGYPRSGSSTLASMLDAHKNIIISHELNSLKYILKGFSQEQIFKLILKNSRLVSNKGRFSSGYKGKVIDQHNGKVEQLKIIGDKKAGGSTLLIQQNPRLLEKLNRTISTPIKCIHIVRNPFDMITTQAYGGNEKQKTIDSNDLHAATHFCFEKIDTVNQLIKNKEIDIYTLKHEELISAPELQLDKLLNWLNLDRDFEYIQACKEHLYTTPHKSRTKYNWTKEEKQLVYDKIREVDFLKGYIFES